MTLWLQLTDKTDMVFATDMAEAVPEIPEPAPLNAKILQVMQVKHKVVLSVLLMLTTLLNGQCISGDCTQGNGVFVFPDGDMYTGTWDSAAMNGYGRYDWSNGSWYVGAFYQNQMQGKGTFYGANGRQMVGLFEANMYVGPDSNTKIYPVFDPATEASILWNALKLQDSTALANTRIKAKQAPICEVITLLAGDFGNRFTSYQGEATTISLGRDNRYYATLWPTGASKALISTSKSDSGRLYTATLFESTDSAQARAQFDIYRNQIAACSLPNCPMQAQQVNSTTTGQSMQTVIWVPDVTCNQDGQSTLQDLAIQLICRSKAGNAGWEVICTMSD